MFPSDAQADALSEPALNATAAHTAEPLPTPILQQLQSKVIAPCFSVWTYWELGEDLLGTPSQERRSALAGLMRELAWPKGSITFWPVAVPLEGGLRPFAADFRQAVNRIKPKLIIVFGKQAFSTLAPQTRYTHFHCEGREPMLVALPDLLDASHTSSLHKQTCDTLRRMRQRQLIDSTENSG